MDAIQFLIPSNLLATLQADFTTVANKIKTKTETTHKVNCAALRLFATIAGCAAVCFLAVKVILPIVTFKFCLYLAMSVAAYVLAKDLFEMARNYEQDFPRNSSQESIDITGHLLNSTEETICAPLYKTLINTWYKA